MNSGGEAAGDDLTLLLVKYAREQLALAAAPDVDVLALDGELQELASPTKSTVVELRFSVGLSMEGHLGSAWHVVGEA